MIEGALILLAGVIAGRFLPNRRRRKLPKPIKPICGCTHGFHTHNAETGECNAQVKVFRYDEVSQTEVLDGYAGCACVRYTGPTPYPEYFAPEIGE